MPESQIIPDLPPSSTVVHRGPLRGRPRLVRAAHLPAVRASLGRATAQGRPARPDWAPWNAVPPHLDRVFAPQPGCMLDEAAIRAASGTTVISLALTDWTRRDRLGDCRCGLVLMLRAREMCTDQT